MVSICYKAHGTIMLVILEARKAEPVGPWALLCLCLPGALEVSCLGKLKW